MHIRHKMNLTPKLDEELVYEILRLYDQKKVEKKKLAYKFGVSHRVIHRILTGQTWKNVYKRFQEEKENSKPLESEKSILIQDVERILLELMSYAGNYAMANDGIPEWKQDVAMTDFQFKAQMTAKNVIRRIENHIKGETK